MIGLAALSGYPGGGPSEVGLSYGDPNAGLHAALAVLAALRHRARTGQGQYIDMSQWEAAIGLVCEGFFEFVMNGRSEEHTSELQSLMRISYAVCCLKKKK